MSGRDYEEGFAAMDAALGALGGHATLVDTSTAVREALLDLVELGGWNAVDGTVARISGAAMRIASELVFGEHEALDQKWCLGESPERKRAPCRAPSNAHTCSLHDYKAHHDDSSELRFKQPTAASERGGLAR